jgi:transketolase
VRAHGTVGKPSVIVLNTVKGKGWPDAERRVPSHYMILSAEQLHDYEAISADRIGSLRAEANHHEGKAGAAQ